MSTIEQKALQLKTLEKDSLRNLAEGKYEVFLESIANFRSTKDEIKKIILQYPMIEIADPEARKTVNSLINGEDLPLEKALSASVVGDFLKEDFDDNELWEIGSDVFYSWFSHYDYITGLLRIGSLIINGSKVPRNLEIFADEARHSYVFQLYHATCSVCRTLIEVTIKDLCIENNILPNDTERIKRLDNRKTSLVNLISELCFLDKYSPFLNRLNRIKRKTNFVVHGNKKVTETEAYETIRESFQLVQDLYDAKQA